jgi:ribose-phosphate pyrophosphokinase
MLFVAHFAQQAGASPLTVVSPDAGGVKRAERFRQSLEQALQQSVTNAFMEKQRSGGVVSGEAFVGDVQGRTAIIVDDLISTGTTLARTARACRDRGAVAVHTAATHGLFVGDANTILADESLDSVVITNTVPPLRLTNSVVRDKLVVLDAAPLVSEAIRRIHTGGSIVELLEAPPTAAPTSQT